MPQQAELKAYSNFYTQGSILVWLQGPYGVPVIDCIAGKCFPPYPLYYFSDSRMF